MSDTTTPVSPLAPETSPLIEADPNSINELIAARIDDIFNKPPILLTDADLRGAVEYYRSQRQRFLLESAEKESKPKVKRATNAKAPKSVAEAIAGSLEDLL